MRSTRNPKKEAVSAAIGYAADPRGNGVAYARVAAQAGEYLLRVPFRMQPASGIDGRDVGYAALRAVACALVARGVRRAELRVDDPSFVDEIASNRPLPGALVLPYIRLRCALNALDACIVGTGEAPDLAARARAEAAYVAA